MKFINIFVEVLKNFGDFKTRLDTTLDTYYCGDYLPYHFMGKRRRKNSQQMGRST